MTSHREWKLFTDGACRNNPGPSSVGFALYHGTTMIHEGGYCVGVMTNNSAEYLALIIGGIELRSHVPEGTPVTIYADSQLLIRQMIGEYKIKQPHLLQLATAARQIMAPYAVEFVHVMREKNTIADAWANKALDEKIQLPKLLGERLLAAGFIAL